MPAKKPLVKLICFWVATALAFAPSPFGLAEVRTPSRAESAIDIAAFNALLQRNVDGDEGALNRLAEDAELLAESDAEFSKQLKEKHQSFSDQELRAMPATELRELLTNNPARLNNSEIRGLKAMVLLAREAAQAAPSDRNAKLEAIREIQAALWNARQPPVPERLGFFNTMVLFAQNFQRPIAEGDKPPTNLAGRKISSDRGTNDPTASTFWTRPASITGHNLYAGFGRAELPSLTNVPLTYDEPKTSSGTHAGFHAKLGSRECRIKFGEENSEPFTSRIFFALGFHTDPTDYAARLKIRYDRRLLREFNFRKSLTMGITPLGFSVYSIQLQPRHDPFKFIAAAVLKNGEQLTSDALRQRLFRDATQLHPEDLPSNYREEVETNLDYLILVPANVQFRAGTARNVGEWQFGGIGHEDRRELRGMGLLAAWLTWFDSRAENTKLRVDSTGSSIHLEHFFSDVGAGLGSGTGWLSQHGEDANALTWTFTHAEIVRGPGRMTTPFRIEFYKPLVPTLAFQNMTVDDARWMARLIGQLSEPQLRAALVASGYNSAQAKLYLEKLINRRDQMIRDLGLTEEISLLRPHGISREFSYDPATDGSFTAKLADGTTAVATESNQRIVRGKLVPY